jgi:hypothetical protein
MLSPYEVMMYVTPVLLLIDRLVGEQLAKSRAAKLAQQTAEANAKLTNASAVQTQRVVTTVIKTAEKNAEDSANLTVTKLEEPGGKMDVIHGLANGTLSVANSKIEALELELARLKEEHENPPMSKPHD